MKRSDVLTTADRLVNGDRDQQYGEPLVVFQRIADLWSAHLGITVTPAQVAQLMILFKVARLGGSPEHVDSWVDCAGYAACGAEVSRAGENVDRAWIDHSGSPINFPDEAMVEVKFRGGSEGVCCADGCDWNHVGFSSDIVAWRFVADA
jgi:hypothetical protein